MIENATAWLERLAARGVTVTVRNNRIAIEPYGEFSKMADDELLFLRHNREAIKAAVRAGFTASAVSEDDEKAAPREISKVRGTWVAPPPPGSDVDSRRSVIGRSESAPIPTACRYCGGPCVGQDRDIYRILHALDPAEVARRDTEATAEMMHMIGHHSIPRR